MLLENPSGRLKYVSTSNNGIDNIIENITIIHLLVVKSDNVDPTLVSFNLSSV